MKLFLFYFILFFFNTQVCGLTALAIPCLLAAFLFKEQWVFYLGMVLGEFLLFSTTSPVNGVFLWCGPPSQRSMSRMLTYADVC